MVKTSNPRARRTRVLRRHVPRQQVEETESRQLDDEMHPLNDMEGPAHDVRDSSEGSILSFDRGNRTRPISINKNGSGLTNGVGMVNGLGLTNMSTGPDRFCPSHAHLHSNQGLTNGRDCECEGLKTDRALINGMTLEICSSMVHPERRLSRIARRHKAMRERVKLRSEIPIDEVGGQ